MLLRAATLRVVEYNELQIKALYALGAKRGRIFKDLFIKLVLSSGVVIAILSFAMSFAYDFIGQSDFDMLFKIKTAYSLFCSLGFVFLSTLASGYALWKYIKKTIEELTGGEYA